ncbi:hypothetical protein DW322_06405 [Rhodococcus rhodnii]|uniref:ESX-1 secretion-associated protein n=2 Tax=Rhodococcus rhodnii TaxID=38312 RepID=R7WSL9_9NOCA|nr:hypothetical protein [Rhodococcus rhodnii]EOM77014.1 hypothetical protein Rrhod_1633 [Rhodococcus rhodnii LMG 5362]TXG89910.1 hypothetical protein DW322_06405 [Rhodococcus rhodnii]
MAVVRLDEGTIEKCVAHCDDMLDKLVDARSLTRTLEIGSAFGGFVSSHQLAAGYNAKANETSECLDRFIDAVTAMREAFVAGGEAYADTDSSVSTKLRSISGSRVS